MVSCRHHRQNHITKRHLNPHWCGRSHGRENRTPRNMHFAAPSREDGPIVAPQPTEICRPCLASSLEAQALEERCKRQMDVLHPRSRPGNMAGSLNHKMYRPRRMELADHAPEAEPESGRNRGRRPCRRRLQDIEQRYTYT